MRLALLALLLSASARAQEIAVTTDIDEFGENPAACSLREAVEAANLGADFGGCAWPGASPTIRLEADRYRFTREGNLEDDNVTGDLDVRVPLRIAGSATAETTINGRFDDRVLHVHGVDVTLEDLRIRHGRTHRDAGGLNGEHGGGILAVNSNLTLLDVVLLENRAGDGDKGSPGGDGGHGGALYLAGGSATLVDVIIRDNRAGDGGREEDDDGTDTMSGSGGDGGALYIVGSLTVTNALIEGNRAGDGGDAGDDGGDTSGGSGGDGGAFWVQGLASLTSAHFDDNRAGDGADETAGSSGGGNGGAGGDGGGLYVLGDATLTDVEILNGRTGSGGDGYDDSEGEFSGPGGDGGAIWVRGDRFAFTRGLVQNNTTSTGGTGEQGGSGGGLYLTLTGPASLTEVQIRSNRTADGSDERWNDEGAGSGGTGGGAFIGAATLRILAASFLDNATGSGGDAEQYPGRAGNGGGLSFSGDSLLVQHSTFARNATGAGGLALDFGSGGRGGDGGALYAADRFASPGRVVIESSTFSGNATGAGGAGDFEPDGRGGYGGAISAYAPLEIRNSTIVSNAVARLDDDAPPTLGGGLYSDATIAIENSIVVGNRNAGAPDDCSGAATASFLLSSTDTGCPMGGPGALAVAPSDVFVTVLEPLQDTGGLTPTHALLPGSPAIDAGACPLESTDQRGFPRPVDDPSTSDASNGCDIGAVETQEGFVVRASDDGPTEADGLALRLAPNPASGSASVALRAEPGERVTVEVLDVRGRRIRTLHEGAVPPDGLALRMDGLPAGVYLVRAVTDTATTSARLTVLR